MSAAVMEVAGNHGVPQGGISLRELNKHMTGIGQGATFRVHVYERAGDEGIELEAGLDDGSVELLAMVEVQLGCAVLEEGRESEPAETLSTCVDSFLVGRSYDSAPGGGGGRGK